MTSVAPPVEAPNLPAFSSSRIPTVLRFPLACIISFGISSLFYSLSSNITGPELAAVSRNLTDEWHIGALVFWKVAELGVAWFADYDYLDLAYLTLLNNVPHYFLLNYFYGVHIASALIPLAIDISAIAIPFWLLRQVDVTHLNRPLKTPNQAVAQDGGVQILSALFGAAVYALVVYGSFATWLPTYLIVHFDGLRSIDKAHSSAIPVLLATFVPLGYAATQFVFVPGVASAENPGITDPNLKPEHAPFDPETATLRETIAWNLGVSKSGMTARAKILAKRTAVLSACVFVNTFTRAYITIEGAELAGAVGWAGVWAVAAACVGIAYSWLGDE